MKKVIPTFIAIIFFVVLVIVMGAFKIVNPGERGVLVTLGDISDVVQDEGLHMIIPFVQRITTIDVKTQKVEYESSSSSKDLQSVRTVVALNFKPDSTSVGKLYQNVGLNYEYKVIKPAIEEAVKSSTAKFTAEELITNRSEVKDAIAQNLSERLTKFFIEVEEVSIVDFSFSAEFDAAIEQKQTAEQQALKEKWNLERVKIQAQQTIEQAKAEAESLRLQRQDLTPELVNLRAIEKWDGVLPKVTGGSTPLVNIQ